MRLMQAYQCERCDKCLGMLVLPFGSGKVGLIVGFGQTASVLLAAQRRKSLVQVVPTASSRPTSTMQTNFILLI